MLMSEATQKARKLFLTNMILFTIEKQEKACAALDYIEALEGLLSEVLDHTSGGSFWSPSDSWSGDVDRAKRKFEEAIK
jgi:hypothetical protein